MTMGDMEFFHQATMKICGNLEVENMIGDFYEFIRDYIPADLVSMNHLDTNNQRIRNVSMISQYNGINRIMPIPISPEIKQMIQSADWVVNVNNQAESHIIGRYFKKYMEDDQFSFLVMRLVYEGKAVGSVGIGSNGHGRYGDEHKRLLQLLHDPFCLALSNSIKHEELHALKELLADDNRYLQQEIHEIRGDEIIGANFGLRNVMEMVRQVSPLSNQVLLLGETGVGKEVIANAIHYSSPRHSGPFIKVNCGAIPESLLDSELFGHEKGAFTGALNRKRGRFERAHGGTIFLDEIGELPPPAQVRLLRVIQNREIERVGGSEPIPVDIRIIAATHRKLEEMVAEGTFREDLWFRLNVFPIVIPPLRQRLGDIPALVNHFIERKSKAMNLTHCPVMATGALEQLREYHWPGNIRELENLVERALIKCRTIPGQPLTFAEFQGTPKTLSLQETQPSAEPTEKGGEDLNLDAANRKLIQAALERTGGRVQGPKGAAALLGINPNTLRNRMKKLKIPYGRESQEILSR
ncbi:MAG: sigma 54-interacting transcriptional regulator [Deltaproteobacteria bacterium]|nr:sigma 54-interacting transcriptional regulator [Deltaproteobacteria bacterium]MBT7150951.1 sigma 54-interacting transcriptional regulator [Deltaproteobacteria bacterium]MBT7715737.1 sigma 54-interacting transcriptional regulator [Deltaproteobacteria bacterium]MBT7892861.1 sigma 54-interacting transcriptional regulator [Deltaproteobacteria bacterium]